LVCGRFINFRKGRKILTLLTFGCPSNYKTLPQGDKEQGNSKKMTEARLGLMPNINDF